MPAKLFPINESVEEKKVVKQKESSTEMDSATETNIEKTIEAVIRKAMTPATSRKAESVNCDEDSTDDEFKDCSSKVSVVTASKSDDSERSQALPSSLKAGASKSNGIDAKVTRRTRRNCTPPRPSPISSASASDKLLKSPPTPHKIQSREKDLRLDENFLAISPSTTTTKNGFTNHTLANNAKPLNSTHQNKAFKLVETENGKRPAAYRDCSERRRQSKVTDFFGQRRSNRKTQEAIKTEKHELLVKAIMDMKQDGLTAKRFEGKGRGVVATRRFQKHEFVVEYAGELLTSSEARDREATYAKDNGAGCYMYYFQYNNQQYCVDATEESNRLGRLINHSRNGNLVTKVVEVKGIPRLILIAKRDIEVDEELCYDYGDRSRQALRHHPWLAY